MTKLGNKYPLEYLHAGVGDHPFLYVTMIPIGCRITNLFLCDIHTTNCHLHGSGRGNITQGEQKLALVEA